MGLQEFRLFRLFSLDLESEIIGRFKGPVVIYSSSNLASLVKVEWVWSGLAFSRQNRGVAPGLRLTLEFHGLAVLELVRGCAMTSHFLCSVRRSCSASTPILTCTSQDLRVSGRDANLPVSL